MEESIAINFDPNSRLALNFILGFIMFGVSLELTWSDITRVFKRPKPTLLGLFAQFVLLPALTFAIVWFWNPLPELALAMFLVAACPGGTVSNFMSSVAKANLGLSVSLTAVSTVLCVFFTPFNFEFWSSLYPPTAELLKSVKMNPIELFQMVFLFLIVPVFAGMFFNYRFKKTTQKIKKPIKWLSMLIFLVFVFVAFNKNRDNFLQHAHLVAALVVAHNAAAFVTGYLTGKLGRLDEKSARSLSLETGIQNSGLGLVICFTFFPEIGEMALLCASWGIWHI
ncbi:MAG: bile acid:sodium symporter family protein, partial [Flavobacteriales bacterium]